MPVTYQISPENRVLVWVFSGKLQNDDLIKTLATAGKDPLYDPDYQVVLIACPDVDPHEITAPMVDQISATAIAELDRDASVRTTRQAVICPEGMVRIFMGFFAAISESNPRYSAEYKHCTTISEAENWIGRNLAGLELVELALSDQFTRVNELVSASER